MLLKMWNTPFPLKRTILDLQRQETTSEVIPDSIFHLHIHQAAESRGMRWPVQAIGLYELSHRRLMTRSDEGGSSAVRLWNLEAKCGVSEGLQCIVLVRHKLFSSPLNKSALSAPLLYCMSFRSKPDV